MMVVEEETTAEEESKAISFLMFHEVGISEHWLGTEPDCMDFGSTAARQARLPCYLNEHYIVSLTCAPMDCELPQIDSTNTIDRPVAYHSQEKAGSLSSHARRLIAWLKPNLRNDMNRKKTYKNNIRVVDFLTYT
jgi:hypothetical protein